MPSKPAEWGEYVTKPEAQSAWENMVKVSVAEVLERDAKADVRPFVKDQGSAQWCLVDTGAAATIIPRKPEDELLADSALVLKAVNGTTVQTYGRKQMTFVLNGAQFKFHAIVADLPYPIIGFDLLTHHKLDIVWKGKKCSLKGPKCVIPLEMHSGADLHVAEVQFFGTYQKWSQHQSQSHVAAKSAMPTAYKNILAEFPTITKVDFTKQPAHNIVHEIDTGNNKPCRSKPRPLMPNSPRAIKGEAAWREMDRLGIIERVGPGVPTTWSSPLHLQPKADGSIRCCGDFRALNHLTTLDSYPMPNLRTFAGKLKGMKVFSRLDLVKAFFQVPISYESSLKTTTVTAWGTWRYKRMPMGLRNSPQSFQKLISHVLDGLESVWVYLDDILVFTKDEPSHQVAVRQLLSRLDAAGLAIAPGKCIFSVPALDFLGYRLDQFGLAPLPRKVDAITSFPTPTKPKMLMGFLGACNFYRRSLPQLDGKSAAEVLQPLYDMCKKSEPTKKFTTIWKQRDGDHHFENAKKLMKLAVKLNHPNPALPLSIASDASKIAVGAVLQHWEEGQWKPLGYFSRHLTPAQSRWSTFRRELLGVKEAVRHFNVEIAGRHCIIYTDHRPLVDAFRSKDTQAYDPIAYNHIMEVANFTSDVRFLSGVMNNVADVLSRPNPEVMGSVYNMPTPEVASVEATLDPEADTITFETVDHRALAESQNQCPEVATHRAGQHPRSVNMADVEFIPGQILFCEIATGKSRPFVPKQWRDKVTSILHGLNHPGPKATARKVESRYYWPSLQSDVAQWARKCKGCQASKSSKTIIPPLDNKPIRHGRFQSLQIDVVGPLVVSEGQRYLLTVIDRASRYFDAFPMPVATSAQCATAFIRGWVRHFGVPLQAESDQGKPFIANLWRELHKRLGVIVSYSPVYRPAAVGHVERQHKELKAGLKAVLVQMASEHQEDWMLALPWTLLGRSTTYQPDIGASPAELVFGSDPRLPGDLAVSHDQPLDVSKLLAELKANANKKPVETSLHTVPKPYFPPSAQTCTHVWVKIAKKTPLGPVKEGPYPIIERVGKSCLRVQMGEMAGGQPRIETLHWSNCAPAHMDENSEIAKRPKLGRKSKKDHSA